MDWKPIKTAPKDGTLILGYWPQLENYEDEMNSCEVRTWFALDQWQNPWDDDIQSPSPTQWMNLPEPPK